MACHFHMTIYKIFKQFLPVTEDDPVWAERKIYIQVTGSNGLPEQANPRAAAVALAIAWKNNDSSGRKYIVLEREE